MPTQTRPGAWNLRTVLSFAVVLPVLPAASALGQEPAVTIPFEKQQPVHSLAFSPDGKLLAFGCGDNWRSEEVRVWDLSAKREKYRFTGHKGQIKSVVISPDGKSLAAAGGMYKEASDIVLWDLATGKRVRQLQGHAVMIECVAFAPDGKTLYSADFEARVKIWDVGTGKELATLCDHRGSVNSVAPSPDGKLLASGGYDETVKIWEVATRKVVRSLKGHKDSIGSMVFSPDGKVIASRGSDDNVKLWDLTTGKETASWEPHPKNVFTSVSFSRDGKVLVTGGGGLTKSEDFVGEIKLWDVATRKLLLRLESHANTPPVSVAFSPDGKFLAGAAHDDSIKLWEFEKLLKRKP